MIQLSLLDLPPIEYEPEPIVAPVPVNPHELAWLQAKADFYLRLMNRFMDGHKCSQEVRSAELVRVYEMRESILAAIRQLENRECNNKSMTTAAYDVTNQQAASNKTQFMERSTNAISA